MGLVGGLRVGQSAGQVLDGFLLRAAGKQLGVVLGLAGLGFGVGFLQAGGLVGDKLHHIFGVTAKKTISPVINSRIITKLAAGRPHSATRLAPMAPPNTPPAQNRVWPQANSVCTTCTKLESQP